MTYGVGNEITYSTEVLNFNVFDYNDVFIQVRGNITITWHNVTQVIFKNCAPFIKCIAKIDGTTIDGVKDLDLVILIYNFLEYSSNYSDTTSSLWLCSKDEATNLNYGIASNNNCKSFI